MYRQSHRFWFSIISLLMLEACSGSGSGQLTLIPAKDAESSLRFFKASDARGVLGVLPAQKADPSFIALKTMQPESKDIQLGEAAVADACANNRHQEALEAVFLAWLVNQGVSYVVKQIDTTLQDEVKKYTANFNAQNSGTLYQSTDNDGPVLANECFRVSRRYKDKDGASRLAMDFVGMLIITRSGKANGTLIMQPLRLYYEKPLALTDTSNVVGVSVKITMDTIWLDRNRGNGEAGVVNRILLSEKVEVPSKTAPYFYRTYLPSQKPRGAPEKDEPAWNDAKKHDVTVALPPWSSATNSKWGENFVTTTVTVSETGNVPWLLQHAADLFHSSASDITKNLSSAADAALGIKTSSSQQTPTAAAP